MKQYVRGTLNTAFLGAGIGAAVAIERLTAWGVGWSDFGDVFAIFGTLGLIAGVLFYATYRLLRWAYS